MLLLKALAIYFLRPNEGLEQAPGDLGLAGIGILVALPCGPPVLLTGLHGSLAITSSPSKIQMKLGIDQCR